MACGIWLLVVVLLGATLYYGAILLGLYKDSLMSHFRRYGEENRIYPLPRFVMSLGALVTVLAPMVGGSITSAVLITLGLLVIVASSLISRIPMLQAVLPGWYYNLLKITTREDRRAIAYAWMRLPLRTRLRLNGDSYAFQVFVDEVRMTVIYGARDPDDPWAAWQ
jgi:hypothetical protein